MQKKDVSVPFDGSIHGEKGRRERTSDADVQVRKMIQQALSEIWGVCEAMNVYLREVFFFFLPSAVEEREEAVSTWSDSARTV